MADAAEVPRNPLRRPVLAEIMERRTLAVVTALALGLQVGLGMLGLPGFRCPVATLFDSHCPGCGLTRSIQALLGGDFQASLRLHAFGPLVLCAALLIAAAAFAPAPARRRLTDAVRRVERRTGLTAFVLFALLAYWLWRLAAGHGRVESLA